MITKTPPRIPPNESMKNNDFSLNAFPVATRLRFQLTLHRSGHLPEYLGSTVRGVLGQALKRIICVTGAKKCAGCLLEATCLYPAFFETPPQLYPLNVFNPRQAKPVGRPSVAVHPWLLDMDSPMSETRFTAGKIIEFSLVLLGEAAKQYIPYLIISFQRAERGGIGNARLPFTLSDVSVEAALGQGVWQSVLKKNKADKAAAWSTLRTVHPTVPPCPEVITLHLQTPLRLKNQGHYLAPQKLTLQHLTYAVIERMSYIQQAWGDPLTANLPLKSTMNSSDFSASRLHWKDWKRYSNRQKTYMKMGGIMGEISFLGASLPQGLWPQLWLAQWLHLGKQTAMGLGQYRCEARKPSVGT